jgi:hypothetical protein
MARPMLASDASPNIGLPTDASVCEINLLVRERNQQVHCAINEEQRERTMSKAEFNLFLHWMMN